MMKNSLMPQAMKSLFHILAVMLMPGFLSYAKGRLEVQGRLPKDTYFYAEPVDIEVVFKNSRNRVIHKEEVKEIWIVVEDERGQSMQGRVSEIYFEAEQRDYQPQESTGEIFNLDRCYAPLFSFYLYARAFPVGNYTVVLAYYNADSARIEQRFPFCVVEPTGEEAVVFAELKRMLNGDKPLYPSYAMLIDSLESLYWKYPNSIYTRITLPAIISFYETFKKDIVGSSRYYSEVFTKYPDTGIGMIFISGYLNRMKTDAEKASFLQQVQKNIKTKAGRLCIDSQLQDMFRK
jgi:hypothetical protein